MKKIHHTHKSEISVIKMTIFSQTGILSHWNSNKNTWRFFNGNLTSDSKIHAHSIKNYNSENSAVIAAFEDTLGSYNK